MASLAAGGTGLATIAASEGGMILDEKRQERILAGEKGETIGDLAFGASMGLTIGALEKVGFNAVFGGKGLPSSVVKKLSSSTARMLSRTIAGTGQEMTTELLQEYIPALSGAAIYENQGTLKGALEAVKEVHSPELFKQLAQAASSAAVVGGIGSTISGAHYTRVENSVMRNDAMTIGKHYKTLAIDDKTMFDKMGAEMTQNGKLKQQVVDGRIQDISQKINSIFGEDYQGINQSLEGLKKQKFKSYDEFSKKTKEIIKDNLNPTQQRFFEEGIKKAQKQAETKGKTDRGGELGDVVAVQNREMAKEAQQYYKAIPDSAKPFFEEGVRSKISKEDINRLSVEEKDAVSTALTKIAELPKAISSDKEGIVKENITNLGGTPPASIDTFVGNTQQTKQQKAQDVNAFEKEISDYESPEQALEAVQQKDWSEIVDENRIEEFKNNVANDLQADSFDNVTKEHLANKMNKIKETKEAKNIEKDLKKAYDQMAKTTKASKDNRPQFVQKIRQPNSNQDLVSTFMAVNNIKDKKTEKQLLEELKEAGKKAQSEKPAKKVQSEKPAKKTQETDKESQAKKTSKPEKNKSSEQAKEAPTKKPAKKSSKINSIEEGEKRMQEIVEPYGGMEKWYKIPEDVQKEYNKISKQVADLRSSTDASTGKGATLAEFEILPERDSSSTARIAEVVQDLVRRHAKRLNQGDVGTKKNGSYNAQTQMIRLKGLNNVSIAAHEIAHHLDTMTGLTDNIVQNTSPKDQTRKGLSNIYEEYYPGGNSKHPLEKRMREGFATLLQKYAEMPSTMEAKYPELVNDFFQKEGRFYDPSYDGLIKDMRKIVSNFQALEPLDKVTSYVVNGDLNKNASSFMNTAQRIRTFIADKIYPLELAGKEAGFENTDADPSLWLRRYHTATPTILANNLFKSVGDEVAIKKGDSAYQKLKKGGQRVMSYGTSKQGGYWTYKNGEIARTLDFNWRTLISQLHNNKSQDDFSGFLVARRVHFENQELQQLKEDLKPFTEEVIAEMETMNDPQLETYKEMKERHDQLEQIQREDMIPVKEAEKAYLENKERFKEFEDMYDQLTRQDLDLLLESQLITPSQHNKLASREGYTPFKRAFYSELIGKADPKGASVLGRNVKVGSTKIRTGSQKPIMNPLMSSLLNHSEILSKASKQMVYNKIAQLYPKVPGLLDKVELKTVPGGTDSVFFPQESSKDYIIARNDYKREAYQINGELRNVLDDVLNPAEMKGLEAFSKGVARMFTKGTTQLYLPFFITTNLPIDSVTTMAQTQNKTKPLYSALQQLSEAIQHRRDSKEGNADVFEYYMEYMVQGGERHTLLGWQNMTVEEFTRQVTGEVGAIKKVTEAINSGMDAVALPTQSSEIMLRASEYVNARKAGKPQVVALEEAGRVTMPFHHIGSWGNTGIDKIVRTIPYFNSSIQVLDQAARSMEDPRTRKQASMVAMLTTFSLVSTAAAIFATGSDEQKRKYENLSPDELSRYIYLPSTNGKDLRKIRIPEQMSFIGAFFSMLVAQRMGNPDYSGSEYLGSLSGILPDQLNPAHMIEGEWSKIAFSWMPHLIKPGMETAFNKRTWPEVIPLENIYQQQKVPGERYYDSTSDVAKWLGKTFNMSPIKIDHFLHSTFGRTFGVAAGTRKIDPKEWFTQQEYFYSKRKIRRFYEIKNKTRQEVNSYKNSDNEEEREIYREARRKQGDIDLIESYIKRYNEIDIEEKPLKAESLKEKIYSKVDKLYN
jgi:hypothetical protein